MAGNDDVYIEAQDVVAGLYPIADRAFPDNRVATDEQKIAGVENAVGGHVDEHIAAGMGRPEMRQHQLFVADRQLHRLVEHRRGWRIDQSAPIKLAAHRFMEERAAVATVLPISR